MSVEAGEVKGVRWHQVGGLGPEDAAYLETAEVLQCPELDGAISRGSG
jgi:hypothetical protein